MPVITIAAEKGGCGKTLMATTLCAAAQNAGLNKILVIDGDSREEVFEWLEARNAAGLCGSIDYKKLSHELSAADQGVDLEEVVKGYDLVIIDTAATHSTFSNDAMVISDIILTPFIANKKDSRRSALARALKIHSVLNHHFPHIKTKLMFTRAHPLNQDKIILPIKDNVRSLGGQYINAFLTDLVAFYDGWEDGLSCFESKVGSAKRAQKEATDLIVEVLESCL